MIKLRIIYSMVICLAGFNAIGQDTAFIDTPSKYYSNTEDSLRFKYRKGPRVNYSRELIKFTDHHYKIEKCYYYDDKRFVHYNSTNYTLINDSLIKINEEIWLYKKINDSLYRVQKTEDNCIEKGVVNSLIPFTKYGDFVTYNSNGKKLFIEKFGTKEYKLETVKYNIEDTIYNAGNVDEIAKFPQKYGDLKRYISERLRFPIYVRESAIQGTVYIRFVITSEGEVINPELLKGVDPLYDKEAIRLVSCLPCFEPGKVNGENVNMYFHIPVTFKLN